VKREITVVINPAVLEFISNYIPCFLDESAGGFIEEVDLGADGVYYSSGCSTADFIHECGHWAVLPSKYRPLIQRTKSIEKIFGSIPWEDSDTYFQLLNSGDQAVMAWSYALSSKLGIESEGMDLELADLDSTIKANSEDYLNSLKHRNHAGIHELQAAGMCKKADFPQLIRWVQT
jgi:hypothetical protein